MPTDPRPTPPSARPAGTATGSPPRAISRPSSAPAPVDAPARTRELLQAVPRVEIPKGGGAVRGIGEKFQANPVTGTASFTVPVALSPGRNGFQPALTLAYDSGTGNGIFGMGWSISLASIRRKTDKGLPRYRDATDEDTFLLSDAEDLVPARSYNTGTHVWSDITGSATEDSVTYATRRYSPRVESAFSLIERWTHPSTHAVHWRTRTRDNVLRVYGLSSQARVVDPDDTNQVFEWLLQEERDELGNVTRYVYETVTTPDSGMHSAGRGLAGNTPTYTYPKRVYYGNVTPGDSTTTFYFEVVFDYGEHTTDTRVAVSVAPTRQDPFSRYRSGFDIRCTRLCRRILLFHRFDPDEDGADDGTDGVASLVRSTEFTYDEGPIATTLSSVAVYGWEADGTRGVGLPAVTFGFIAASVSSDVEYVSGVSDLPGGFDVSRHQWVDLDGEGLPGLLMEQAGAWWYRRNEGDGVMGDAIALPTHPMTGLAAGRLMDLDGDGRLELVQSGGGLPGSYARTSDGDWERFRPFDTLPTTPLDDPRVQHIDLDGDGQMDLLVAAEFWMEWYRSRGVDGYEQGGIENRPEREERGPVVLYVNDRTAIFLADMSGDGLTDLVWVRNGNICYWPNRGYGRFGARVQMADSPWFDHEERFDARRVRFADVDGAGPADLIYIGPERARWWPNQSGNGFGAEQTVPAFPWVDDATVVTVADVRGEGTACLCWASRLAGDTARPLGYVRMMSGGKPYLLQSVDNGLGRTTTLAYTPSTASYVEDRRSAHPWATRLGFPVQCLTQVTVSDAVTGWSNTTTYAYHHGYFDGAEREFRGFGKVEQWDTEAFPVGEDTTVLPPVRTVTWFHTGAWQQAQALEDAFATEYFTGDADAFERTACVVGIADADAAALTALERQEAARAFKDRPLRQEVYAEDGTGVADIPYTVTETCFTASRLQRADDDTHGVFLVTPLQTLTYHYERDVSDPRIVQERTLEVDLYGTVTKAATVVYPRRGTGHDSAQSTGVVLVSRTEVIHDTSTADRWHVGVPFRARTWHFTPDLDLRYTLHTATGFFGRLVDPDATFGTDGADGTLRDWLDVAELGGSGTTTDVLDWDATASTVPWLRKIADQLTTYDDGSGDEADAGAMGPRALPYQKYQLALTTTQAGALDDRLDDLGLGSTHAVVDQGYIELDGVAGLDAVDDDVAGTWARSGTQIRDAAHFYVPTQFTDAFGGDTTVEWHRSSLFPGTVTDPLNNAVSATYDVRALAPSAVTDPNRNVTLARYDVLGRVTAIARASDTADGETDLDDPSQLFSYDVGVTPAVASGSVRDLHASESGTAQWISTYSYSDGAGNVVLQKATAAPDVDTPSTPRWVGTGRVVLNNKCLPIKQYEPFFATSSAFEAEEGFDGVTPVITYDPVGRPIRVDLPNGTLRRASFTPWRQVTFDENDTSAEATEADPDLTDRAATHVDTPTVVKLDVQGRPYRTREFLAAVDDSVYEAGGSAVVTTLSLDVLGNPLTVTDARDNEIQVQTFDLLGRPILTSSPDGGDITALLDVTGQPRFLWKSGEMCEEAEYDALRRRVRSWEWTNPSAPEKTLRERFVYGEGLYDEDPVTHDVIYEPADDDLRGRLYRVYDGAGALEMAYDWKGNTTSTTRRFLGDEEGQGDWTDADGEDAGYAFGGDTPTTIADLETAAAGALDAETFTTTTTFDALDRVVTSEAPDRQVASHSYDAGGRLLAVSVGSTSVVSSITYNARGQRAGIAYGNGTATSYTYEPDTFRLSTLVTTRTSDDAVLQSLTYAYDPVGNITGILNGADDTLYYDNTAVSPDQGFLYDALYRLIEASGREKGDRTQPWSDDPSFLDIPNTEELRAYVEQYNYDGVGNITSMVHKEGASTLWTRTYTYDSASNRLETTTEAAGTQHYAHDDRGNMVYLPNLLHSSTQDPNVTPNFRDQMVAVLLASSGETAFYAYDAGGQRVRKVVKTGTHSERRYLGAWEVYREYDGGGGVEEERTTLHVMDGEQRVLMIETKTVEGGDAIDPDDQEPVFRYQLGNHLGSVSVEVDVDGNIFSYEEYHPYGSTAWWAGVATILVSRKRYRYTGMERDEETGLQCHGRRYFAPWLGRWTSADPIGVSDGVNRFAYARESPVGFVDRNGLSALGIFLAIIPKANQDEADPTPDPEASPPVSGVSDAHSLRAFDVVQPRSIDSAPAGEARRQATIGPAPSAAPADNLESGTLGPGGTAFIVGKEARGAWENDSSYVSFSPTDQALAEMLDGAMTAHALGAADQAAQLSLRDDELFVPEFSQHDGRLPLKASSTAGEFRGSALSESLKAAGQAPDRGEFTKAGRALAKHGGREGSVFRRPTGSPEAINRQGQAVLNNILDNLTSTRPNKYGGIDYYGGSTGGGARFDSSGNFIGYLEP